MRMALSDEVRAKLRRFVQESSFATSGVVVTDLDGTAGHEYVDTSDYKSLAEFRLRLSGALDLYSIGSAAQEHASA